MTVEKCIEGTFNLFFDLEDTLLQLSNSKIEWNGAIGKISLPYKFADESNMVDDVVTVNLTSTENSIKFTLIKVLVI